MRARPCGIPVPEARRRTDRTLATPLLLPYRFPGSHPGRTGIPGASLGDQYSLAARGAGLEPLVSSAYVVEREALLGWQLDAARLVHRPHVTRHHRHHLDLAFQRAEPQRCCGDKGVLREQRVEVEGALAAALEPDDDEAAVAGERSDVGLEVLRTHDVEQHIDAATPGRLLHRRRPVLVVVDRDVRAQRPALVELLGRTGREARPVPGAGRG